MNLDKQHILFYLFLAGLIILYFIGYFLVQSVKKKKRKETSVEFQNADSLARLEVTEVDEENLTDTVKDSMDEEISLLVDAANEEDESSDIDEPEDEVLIEKIEEVKFKIDLLELNKIGRITQHSIITKEEIENLLKKGERFK
jgi:hypothetical protein